MCKGHVQVQVVSRCVDTIWPCRHLPSRRADTCSDPCRATALYVDPSCTAQRLFGHVPGSTEGPWLHRQPLTSQLVAAWWWRRRLRFRCCDVDSEYVHAVHVHMHLLNCKHTQSYILLINLQQTHNSQLVSWIGPDRHNETCCLPALSEERCCRL